MPELRPYQIEVIQRCRDAFASGIRRILLVAPTGAGKTVLSAEMVRTAQEKNRRVLFLVHRRELLGQAANKLHAIGIDAGTIAAGFEPRPSQTVQVASISTLHARAMRSARMQLPPADLVVVDEAHHSAAKTWRDIVNSYPDAALVGLTATPCRGDGRGLGSIFETMVECPGVSDLVKLGYLTGTRVYAPGAPDLSGVKITAGDYNEKALALVMNQDELVGDVVLHWQRHAEGRKTLVYAVDVAHSMHIRDEFCQAGIAAGHIDGTTPAEERDSILSQLRRGSLDVVSNCQVLTEGFDCPDVGCVILARPTKSFGMYRQIVGRGLRPSPEKPDNLCIVIDHSGATLEHGFVDEPVEWSLKEDTKAASKTVASATVAKVRKLVDCPECGSVRWQGRPCSCGWRPVGYGEGQPFMDGDLIELDRAGNPRKPASAGDKWEPESFYKQLLGYSRERGFADGWAAHKYREKFATWPKRGWAIPEAPSPEIRSWVRSRLIQWAKSKERENAA